MFSKNNVVIKHLYLLAAIMTVVAVISTTVQTMTILRKIENSGSGANG